MEALMGRVSIGVLAMGWWLLGSTCAARAADALPETPRVILLADGALIHPKLAETIMGELKGAGVAVSVRGELAATGLDAPAGSADLLLVLTDVGGPAEGSAPLVELAAIDPPKAARC